MSLKAREPVCEDRVVLFTHTFLQLPYRSRKNAFLTCPALPALPSHPVLCTALLH